MPTLWFCVPVHGRVELARICLRQLRRTCDALTAEGIEASAVIVGNDENLDTARELGFATFERDNLYLSRKYNDGFELAFNPEVNPRPADYVVPCGSDDWVDHRLFLDLPGPREVYGFQTVSFVQEDGRQISTTRLNVAGGCGIRIYPRALIKPLAWRPAEEDFRSGCDTSILYNVKRQWENTVRVYHLHLHDRQIVDWKTPGGNVTPFDRIAGRHKYTLDGDPFLALRGFYPDDHLAEMRELYASREILAA